MSQSPRGKDNVIMKVVPIESVPGSSEVKPSLTWMSWLCRMIIFISPASVDKGWTAIKFKFFSRSTFLHLFFFFGPMPILVLASCINGDHSQIMMKSWVGTFETYNLVDALSVFFMMLALPMACIIPFLMSTGISSISSLALARDLSWPKYGIFGPLGAFLFWSADLLGEYMIACNDFIKKKDLKSLAKYINAASYGLLEPWMSDNSWTPTVTALFAIFFVILALWISFTGLFFVCLISWVEKLILTASVEPRFHPCTVAQHCLSSYNCLQQSMSTTFFAFFTYSQKDFIFAQS